MSITNVLDRKEHKMLLDLRIASSRIAWKALDKYLAINPLNRSRSVLFRIAENYMCPW